MATQAATSTTAAPVTIDNFKRAETDMYFQKFVADGKLGAFLHAREMSPIDKQSVVRMNRDTLYSYGVFDLDAAPVKVTLPDTGKRFMSMQVINEDHYTLETVYAPGTYSYHKTRTDTRYLLLLIRTLANPEDDVDTKAANAAQDGIKVEQVSTGSFEVANWDSQSRDKVREALNGLSKVMGQTNGVMFGTKAAVDPVLHLIGTAIGWGGNPPDAAIYHLFNPKANDGNTVHTLTLKDVPVDGFWSVSLYNAKGFFEKNPLGKYSLNKLTAKPNADGSVTVQFGGCDQNTPNCLPIFPGWNYTVRLYRPHKEIVDGTWQLPEAQPAT